jgi:hypothetical protein
LHVARALRSHACRHVSIDPDRVQVKLDQHEWMSNHAVDIDFPHAAAEGRLLRKCRSGSVQFELAREDFQLPYHLVVYGFADFTRRNRSQHSGSTDTI